MAKEWTAIELVGECLNMLHVRGDAERDTVRQWALAWCASDIELARLDDGDENLMALARVEEAISHHLDDIGYLDLESPLPELWALEMLAEIECAELDLAREYPEE